MKWRERLDCTKYEKIHRISVHQKRHFYALLPLFVLTSVRLVQRCVMNLIKQTRLFIVSFQTHQFAQQPFEQGGKHDAMHI